MKDGIDLLDKIDINYYNNLNKIHNLFTKEKKFKIRIGNKLSNDSVGQSIVFVNKKNGTEKFILTIHNKYSINVKIPIKQSNYIFTTHFNCINNVYNFLKLHI